MSVFAARAFLAIFILLLAAQTQAQQFRAFDPERIFMLGDAAYRLALGRGATMAEQTRAGTFLRDFAAPVGGANAKRGAWSAFCQALFARAEFRYLD